MNISKAHRENIAQFSRSVDIKNQLIALRMYEGFGLKRHEVIRYYLEDNAHSEFYPQDEAGFCSNNLIRGSYISINYVLYDENKEKLVWHEWHEAKSADLYVYIFEDVTDMLSMPCTGNFSDFLDSALNEVEKFIKESPSRKMYFLDGR